MLNWVKFQEILHVGVSWKLNKSKLQNAEPYMYSKISNTTSRDVFVLRSLGYKIWEMVLFFLALQLSHFTLDWTHYLHRDDRAGGPEEKPKDIRECQYKFLSLGTRCCCFCRQQLWGKCYQEVENYSNGNDGLSIKVNCPFFSKSEYHPLSRSTLQILV